MMGKKNSEYNITSILLCENDLSVSAYIYLFIYYINIFDK